MKKLLALLLLVPFLPECYAQVCGQRTQALDDSAWECSQWISVADAPVVTGIITPDNERAADGAGWFVSRICNDRKVAAARWMTTGLGVYELYVNGTRIGSEVLKPGFTHYAKTKRSYTYDITDLLRLGKGAENIFAAEVTPGWWADKIVTVGYREGMQGRKVAFRGVIELTYKDGTKKLFGTDTEQWQAGICGPVKHAAIFDGEEYDARCPLGFETPEKLARPEVNNEFAGEILPSEGAEIYLREDLALAPVRAYTWSGVTGSSDDAYGRVVITREFSDGEELVIRPDETLVVDFGQNCAGVPLFEFSAAEGTHLRCLPAELLNDGNGAKSRGMDGPEGSCHRLNLRIPDTGMLLDYTFGSRQGFVSYRPSFTFYGYRFVSITADAEVRIRSLRSIPVSSVSHNLETGTIVTGDESINRLIANTYWGQLSNYLSVPTDCPQRNERLGWTADTQVFAETGTYFADTDSFFRKWMRDIRDTQTETGAFPGVAPLAQYGALPTDMMRLGWADAGVIVPWVVWKQFGDTKIIDENWEAMERFVEHIAETKYDHHALVNENGNYQWADWLSYEPLESCSGRAYDRDEEGNLFVRPETYEYWNYLSANYWLSDAAMMCDMARASGRDAAKYEAMVSEARAYIVDRFLCDDGSFRTPILNTMQTPALFALRNRTVDGQARENMKARLRENFAGHGNCLQTGFLGTSILMPTLSENGMDDIAYELLFQRSNPSWLYSVDNGATTIWERWNSYTIEHGLGPQGMNSFNHYAYGCVCQWIWETVAGIAADTSAPGFKRIRMRPVPDRRLGYVKASYRSAAGLIESSWRYEGDRWIWEFSIPEGTVAEVALPDGSPTREYAAGRYKIEIGD